MRIELLSCVVVAWGREGVGKGGVGEEDIVVVAHLHRLTQGMRQCPGVILRKRETHNGKQGAKARARRTSVAVFEIPFCSSTSRALAEASVSVSCTFPESVFSGPTTRDPRLASMDWK